MMKKSQVDFKRHTNQAHEMSWNAKINTNTKSASMNSHKQILWCETCSHHHSILQQPYSVHTINLTFYNQLNSAHLGVEGMGTRGFCDYIQFYVVSLKITLLVRE